MEEDYEPIFGKIDYFGEKLRKDLRQNTRQSSIVYIYS